MTRSAFKLRILALLAAVLLPISAATQSPPANEVTVAMTVTVVESASYDEVRKALLAVVAELRKQPGSAGDVMLENVVRNARPSHMLVMRWRSLGDWEATLANTQLWKSLDKHRGLFTLNRAGIFQELK